VALYLRKAIRVGPFYLNLSKSGIGVSAGIPGLRLHDRLHTYQSTHRRLQWGTVRVITDPNLLLIEEALAVYLWYATTPSLGYKLAAAYCEHYDPRYGPGLNGPSRDRLQELIAFVRAREAQEVAHSRPSARDA
jgi:hypothetical protein